MFKDLHKTLRTGALCLAAFAAVALGVMNAQAARIPLGALTTLNLSTHLDPMFVDLYDLREQITTPSYTAATPKLTITSGGALQVANGQQLQFGGSVDAVAGSNATHSVSIYTNNIKALEVDSAQNVRLVGGGALGYGSGSGGTVSQATSKATDVTLNKSVGRITMHNASLAASATVYFNLLNSFIAATDIVIVTVSNGGSTTAYQAWVPYTTSGSAQIAVRNNSGGSLGEAVTLNFAVIKGSTS